MGIKDNFSQAVKELMNKDKGTQQNTADSGDEIQFKGVNQYMSEDIPAENPVVLNSGVGTQETPKQEEQTVKPEPVEAVKQEEQKKPEPIFTPQEVKPAPQATQNFKPSGLVDDDETTIISRNTVIDGNIRSFANMSIDGNIKGDVETTKDVSMNGKIVGNITCNNATMATSSMQGNVKLKGKIDMARDALLIGDLASQYADINGKIKGNIDITGKAELKKDAVIFGDIKASTISILDGAIIQGYVSTTFLTKEEGNNIFPESIAIGE